MTTLNPALTEREVRAAAEALHRAETQRVQVRATSILYPRMTLGDAYRVQQALVEHKLAEGQTVVGRKIGLTSKAMQRAMHIDEPDYGTLLSAMAFASGDVIEAARYTDPRIEVELAFVLNQRLLGDELGADDVLRATRCVVPALELIAARSFRIDPQTGEPRGLLDTVADNAASAGFVLGEPFSPADVDLRWCGAILHRNDVVEETGLAAGVLDHPANGVAWLARRLWSHGVALEAGQVILSGSFTRPVEVAAGDRIVADYGPHGVIHCRFE